MTAIEWTWVPDGKGGTKRGETWNPQVGCREVSPACEHCYAAGMAHRGMSPQHRGLTVLRKTGVHWNGSISRVPELLLQPLSWREPRGIFVGSMTDTFYFDKRGPEVYEWIASLFAVMAACPQHTFILLTKRPEDAKEWFRWLDSQARALDKVWAVPGHSPHIEICRRQLIKRLPQDTRTKTILRLTSARPWPLPNVWLGVTAEDQQRANVRVPVLLDLPAAVRFVSYEPALGPVDWSEWISARFNADPYGLEPKNRFSRAPSLDWIIAGGESGPKARPSHVDWFRSTRDQCEAAGVPLFFKQHGEWAPPDQLPDDEWSRLDAGGKLSDEELAGDKPIRVGKGRAGRLLDGRTHDEFPEVEP